MISQEQAESLKKQLLSQLENSSIQNKEEIKASITEMNKDELEEFLIKNNLIKSSNSEIAPGKCIFCSIADSKIPSYKIGENMEAVAVLEINPISKGHVIIIPKIHSDKTPEASIELATEVSERIKTLKPKSIEVIPATVMGHGILNVLPVYSNETMNSQRKRADEKELQELYKILTEKKDVDNKKSSWAKKSRKPRAKKISEKKNWLPRRIP
ncbi:HIT domain-containing protein [Candidatus Pacearchaeota archaeon]|nr:HIT domain-containing protein [Candidatus Pacearchaeota archaeon]